MEPIIYHTIVLELPVATTRGFLETFEARPIEFFAKYVKELYLTSIISFPQARRLVAACTGIRNLVCWADPGKFSEENLAELLPPKIIQKLSVKVEALWGTTSGSHTPHLSRFSSHLFSSLTHLEIVNPPGVDSPLQIDWEGLCHLPALTHLAFGDLWHWGHLYLVPSFRQVLDDAPKLKALIAVSRDGALVEHLQLQKVLVDDPRFVVLLQCKWPVTLATYWDIVKRGGPDFWYIADEKVQKQLREVLSCLFGFECAHADGFLVKEQRPDAPSKQEYGDSIRLITSSYHLTEVGRLLVGGLILKKRHS